MSAVSWDDDAFFATPPAESLDGGTTNLGPLWHAASPRWGHAAHAMCSYQGMFPAKLVHYFVQRYSRPGRSRRRPVQRPWHDRAAGARRRPAHDRQRPQPAGVRADARQGRPAGVERASLRSSTTSRRSTAPAGRGSRLRRRDPHAVPPATPWRSSASCVLACSSKPLTELVARGGDGRRVRRRHPARQLPQATARRSTSASACRTPSAWRRAYVKKYIRDKGLVAPDQDVFDRLREKVARQYLDSMDGPAGAAQNRDAVEFLTDKALKGRVDLLVTSPPYLRVVNYGTSNWIRLWWLGLDGVSRNGGGGRKSLDAELDHGHRYEPYRDFILARADQHPPGAQAHGRRRCRDRRRGDAGSAIDRARREAVGGDRRPDRAAADRASSTTTSPPAARSAACSARRRVRPPTGTACSSSPATTASRTSTTREIDWSEPYKDGGPDAAHAIVRRK